MWEVYWGRDRPQQENYCRNRLIEPISTRFPEAIRLEQEASMPQRRRVDIALIRNVIKLPVEIKGQWKRDRDSRRVIFPSTGSPAGYPRCLAGSVRA